MNFTSRSEANQFYADTLQDAERDGCVPEVMAELGRRDLWFLLTRLLNRMDMNLRPEIDPEWLFARCVEVQNDPDGMLDLWAREFYKSTIITFALTIQDILNDPEATFGIFSVKRELSQDFLKQIKQEFETNELLKDLYPEILYRDPERESPCWGIEKGIRVKRTSNSREETVEAWGLIGGMPTGKHFKVLVYDDVVTEKSVTNPDQLAKSFDAMRLSFSLGSHGGRRRMIGTRYHFNDAWGQALKDGIAEPRIHPATDDGKVDGKPVFLTAKSLADKRRDQGPYIYACQMLQNPIADSIQGFKLEWLRYYSKVDPDKMNLYLLCDPAGEKKKTNDYTVMEVIGLGTDGNYYTIDGIRDRLNLTERTKKLMDFHRQYKPKAVGYEKYGKDSDIEHIEYVMEQEQYRFEITPLGGATPKNDRIRKLVPVFEQGRWYMPHRLIYIDYEQKAKDFVKTFVDEEYLAFPVGVHDDMFDCKARIVDPELGAVFPQEKPDVGIRDHLLTRTHEPEVYNPFR